VQWQIHCKRLVERKHEQHRQARAQRRRRARWTGPGACRARLFEYARRRAAGTSRNMRTRTGQPPPCCLLRDFLPWDRNISRNSGSDLFNILILSALKKKIARERCYYEPPLAAGQVAAMRRGTTSPQRKSRFLSVTKFDQENRGPGAEKLHARRSNPNAVTEGNRN